MVDEQWTDSRACLYYKLTNEPKGSGELKIHVNACVTVKPLAGFLQCNGGKLEESEGYNCTFIVSCVL